MQDSSSGTISLKQYWDAIRRRRRSMFLAFLLTWALACAAAWLLPASYRSSATILMQKPKVPKQLVTPNIESDPNAELEELTQQILSRSLLQRVIDDFHLYTKGFAGFVAGDPVAQMRKDIQIDQVLTQSKPPQLAGFTISYSSHERRVAQDVASRLTSLIIEQNLQAREKQAENTTAFLDQQLQDVRADLEEQTKRVKEFKAQYVGHLPGELQSNLQILNGLQGRLQQANEALNRSEQQRLYLSSMLSAYRDRPSLAAGTTGTKVDVDAQLARLKATLDELKSRYTDKHPAVLQVRDQIAETEKLKAEFDKDKIDDDSGLPVSRGVEEIKSQLKGTELNIQDRKKEIASMQAAVEAYENRLKDTPLREQQLADLTRDYNQSRDNYEALLTKKNDSALATDMEKAQQGEQFTLLDPPSFPVSPYFPNRLLTTLGGLAAGLAAAFAAAFMRETLDDSIHADSEIIKLSKAPVLVAIPPMITARDITGARWRAIGESCCAIVTLIMVTASALVAFYYG